MKRPAVWLFVCAVFLCSCGSAGMGIDRYDLLEITFLNFPGPEKDSQNPLEVSDLCSLVVVNYRQTYQYQTVIPQGRYEIESLHPGNIIPEKDSVRLGLLVRKDVEIESVELHFRGPYTLFSQSYPVKSLKEEKTSRFFLDLNHRNVKIVDYTLEFDLGGGLYGPLW